MEGDVFKQATEQLLQTGTRHGKASIHVAYAGVQVVCSVIFFHILNWTVIKFYPGSGSDYWKWKNLFISWIHAILIGSWVLYCLFSYPEIFQDPIAFHNVVIHSGVCFSTGYFFYDFSDICLNGMMGKMWEVLLHHVLVLSIFLYNLWWSVCLAFTIVALAVEINSVFLHARKLLQMQKVPYDAPLYIVVKYANLATFVVARFGAMVAIWTTIVVCWAEFSTVLATMLSTIMVAMVIINTMLFWRLLQSDLFRKKGQKVSKKTQGEGLVNNNDATFTMK